MSLKQLLFALIPFIVISCDGGMIDTSVNDGVDFKLDSSFKSGNFLLNDSLSSTFVQFNYIDEVESHEIIWGNAEFDSSGLLNVITRGNGYRIPPDVLWLNENYICLMTNFSGPFSEHVFLPLSNKFDIRYFQEDIEWMDTTTMDIAYITEVNTTSHKVHWTIENLITKRISTFEVPFAAEDVGYPWYTQIYLKSGNLVIEQVTQTIEVHFK